MNREAIEKWIEQGEIPPFEMPEQDDTIMGKGFCNGDCHACPDMERCAMEYYPYPDAQASEIVEQA